MRANHVVQELPPEAVLKPADYAVADMIGLSHPDLEVLTTTHLHHLGEVSILGTNDHAPVKRVHVGPPGSIKRGGTKFKFYTLDELQKPLVRDEELQIDDLVDHGGSMFFKIGGIGETGRHAEANRWGPVETIKAATQEEETSGYGGAKTSANFDPYTATDAQRADAMRQTALLMREAGLDDPRIDGTAGDQGTNDLSPNYIEALRKAGHLHPEATITGKPDMPTRLAATGKGGAIAHRTRMSLTGQSRVRSVVQGMGPAGAYYAAEAYDPQYADDRANYEIILPAVGDLLIEGSRKTPITLSTNHPDGLPITKRMIDSILTDPTDRDMNHEKVRGNKVFALARKTERLGREVRLVVGQDVLTYDLGAECFVPAATSNVITPDNIDDIVIEEMIELGNHVVRWDAEPLLGPRGIRRVPGELLNAGGVKISIEENRRDLRRIRAAETEGLYLPVNDAVYDERLRTTMIKSTRQTHAVAHKFGIDLQTATKVVALGNYAVSYGKTINDSTRDLLAA